jgi:maleate cis-trans isomerase
MWEKNIPKRRIGTLAPLAQIEYAPYEFYRLVPPSRGVMTIYVSVGLEKFSAKDVNRVFKPVEKMCKELAQRECDIIVQSGVPLPILIGVKAHDRLMKRIAKAGKCKVSSSVTAVAKAARHLGIKKIACANKWSPAMNKNLGEFFARERVKMIGVSSQIMTPDQFPDLSTKGGMDLAYDLGKRAIKENPGCDGLYIGGGAWLAYPVAHLIEKKFGIPCISNQDAVLWDCLKQVKYWKPIKGETKLLRSR